MKLTGNTRYRMHHRWFRRPLLVLQVEVEILEHVTGSSLFDWATRWKDATFETLQVLELNKSLQEKD